MAHDPASSRPGYSSALLAALIAFVAWSSGGAAAQSLTGALVGTVTDEQGGAVPGAVVRVSSPALIGGSTTVMTDGRGVLRFPVLPPGTYVIDVELSGFTPYHEADVVIGVSATLERAVVL